MRGYTKAATIVSFGALGRVMAAFMMWQLFSLVELVICTADETMRFDEWYDGESNQMRIYCVNGVTGVEKERTLLFVGVVLGAIFLVIFWAVWGVITIARMAAKSRG